MPGGTTRRLRVNQGLRNVLPIVSLLTIGYEMLIKASMDVTEEILKSYDMDESIRDRYFLTPVEYLVPSLVNMLATDSKESQDLEAKKNKQIPTLVHNPLPVSIPEKPTSVESGRPCTPTESLPRLPQSSYQTPVQQRTVSSASFGTQSTETTPNKLIHAEAKVQSLQNDFVKCVLSTLWSSRIQLSWVSGRKMYLVYEE
jgi:hypothetical protein